MYHFHSQGVRAVTFRRFSRKGYALLTCFHREVRIGVLSAAMLACAAPRLMAASAAVAEGTMAPAEEDAAVAAVTETALPADSLLPATLTREAEVTASRAPLGAGLTARQVTVLTRDELASAGVRTINDALKLSSAIDVRQRGAFGIQTDISIDGGTHDQIAILLNGVPLVNPQTGHNAADFPVNLSDIERIEVLEGAASRVMGSQAFSGAINIVTRSGAAADGSRPSPLEARFEGGSYATFRGEARTAWRWGKGWSASASGSGQRSDGAVTNGDFKGGKGFALLSYDASDLRFDLQAGATANDFGANTFYSAAYPDQWEATRRYILSARAASRGRLHLTPQLSWVRSLDHFQLTRHSDKGENFHRTDVFTVGLSGWGDWALGRTSFGAEMRRENIFSTNLGNPLTEDRYLHIRGEEGRYYTRSADRTNISYFFEHNVVFARRFTLSAGVMAETNTGVDSRYRFYPGVDLSYRPIRPVRLYASWERAMRLPSFTDLWYKSPTQEGNVGLRPEECWTARLGADLSWPGVSVKAKAHYRRGTHMIDWIMRSADDIYHATSFSLDNYGLGLDAALDLSHLFGKRQPLERLAISYTWLGQHRRAGEAYFKSNYAMEYLRHKFVATLRHRIVSRLHADWTLRVQQREGSYLVYRNLKPTAELQPYGTHALLDLRLTWAARRWSVYADLSNLTNHRYYDLANVRQPGFVALGGATFRW